ncbi:MAG: trypsin-like serine peptidase [Propioniciclava sp.]
MSNDFILRYEPPEHEGRNVPSTGKQTPTKGRGSRPLTPREVAEQLPERPALNPVADPAIDLDLNVSALGEPEFSIERQSLPGGYLAGRPTGELREAVPWRLQLRLTNAAVGIHAFPPRAQVVEVKPELGIGEAQEHRFEFPGKLPDHLPLRTTPATLPPELRRARRSLVDPGGKGLGEDVHEATTVFSPDDRYLFNDTADPWCTVGRVETPGGWASGTMVGPRHLLTCSHVMQWNSDGTVGWVRFTPSYFDGSAPFGVAWGTRVYWEGVKVYGPSINRNEGQHDYVCVVLDRTIGDLTGWMGSRSWSDDWDGLSVWRHIGYPSDLANMERPSYQSGISLDGSFWDREVHTRIFHRGDVWPGQSGGPFFAWWSGEDFPRVVADQSGQNSDENSASGGAHMVNCIIRARNDHP